MSVNLGEVYAEARLDTKKLHSDVGAADSKLGKFAHGMGTVLKAGAVAGAAAVAGLGAAFMTAVKDLGELDKLTKQVEAGISSTGGAAGVTAEHVVELSSSLEGMSSITQESILQGQNLLLTFTNIQNKAGEGNDIFDQASLAMTNMAAKMGVDASTAAMQLGKALNDPVGGIGALRKAGVQLSDEQEKMVKSFVEQGNVMEAQKIILGELNKEFAGSAEAMGNSIPGAIALAKDAFGDFLRDGVAPIGGAIKDVSRGFIDMLQGLDSSALQGAFSGISNVIKSLLPTIGTIGDALMQAFAKIAPIISGALERLAPLFDRVLTAILPLIDPLVEIGEILINAILDVVEAIMPAVEALAPIVKTILEFVAEVLKKISPVLGEIISKLADIVARILEKMEPYIERILDATMRVIDAVLPVLPEILDLLLPILELLLKLVDPLMAIMVKTQELYATVMETIGGLVRWLVDTLGNWVNWLVTWGEKVWQAFKAIWDKVVAIWHAVMDPLFEVIRTAWEAVSGVLSAIWDGIRTAAGTVWDAIKTAIWTPVETVWGMLVNAWNTIAGTLASIWEGIKDTAASIWNGLIDAIKGGINVAITGINTLIDGANAALAAADAAAGPWVNFGEIPHIPYLHTGGYVPEEQPYMLKGNEYVINSMAVDRWGRGLFDAINAGLSPAVAGGNTFNFGSLVLPNVTNAEEFLDELAREAEKRAVVLA